MSNQLQITGGAKVRSLEGVITGTTGVLSSLPINASNGIPQLDVNGKILVSQLPNSVMEYQGTWNATTNTPYLVNGVGNAGDVYLVSTGGVHDFGAGAITFVVSDQVIYSGSIWQKASGSNGTVTSVAVTETGDALSITGSPITTSGTINIGFAGSSAQYVAGDGTLITFPTLISSIGLSMPSAFSVSNSPLTANGTIAVTGAGTTSQYIRGDGSLATYNPGGGGGGASQSFYFNGSVSSGVSGYEQMSTIANTGASADFSVSSNGYIASFLTDSGSPNQLAIPAGNWNFEIYFNSSSSGGSPYFYVELYKYNGSTFTLIASSSANPEYITNGTSVDLYFTALTVPATTLSLTDRLAVRVYVVPAGRTITMHTQDSNLSEVITTFTTGITALNGLTAQVQNFAVGTSGSDFNISSVTSTHTFNLPTASATNRGALSSADWNTFNGKQGTITLTTTGSSGSSTLVSNTLNVPTYTLTGLGGQPLATNLTSLSGLSFVSTSFVKMTASGTFALDTNSYLSISGGNLTGVLNANAGIYVNADINIPLALKYNTVGISGTAGFTSFGATANTFIIYNGDGKGATFNYNSSSALYYYLPASSGTFALTSQLNSGTVTSVAALTLGTTGTDLSSSVATGTTTPVITLNVPTASASNRGALSSADWTTFNNKQNTITNPVTGTSTSGYVTYWNGTSSVAGSVNHYWDNTNSRLGIGTTNPQRSLTIYNATADNHLQIAGVAPSVSLTEAVTGAIYQAKFGLATAGGQYVSGAVAGDFVIISQTGATIWATSGGEKMRLTSGGSLGIGNSSPSYTLDVTGTGRFTSDLTSLTIKSTYTGSTNYNSFGNELFIGTNGANNNYFSDNMYYNGGWLLAKAGAGAQIYFGASAAGSIDFRTAPTGAAGGTPTITNRMTILQGGNVGIGTSSPGNLLTLYATTTPTIAFQNSGAVRGYLSADSGNNIYNAVTGNGHVFQCDSTERIRITSLGQLQIKQGADTYSYGYRMINSASNRWSFVNGGDNNLYYGYNEVDKGVFNNSTGAYTTLSDINKKKDFEDSIIGLNAILGLKPTLFRMKDEEGTEKHLGFIAQEVKEFIPQAYSENKNGDNIFIGLTEMPIIAALVKAIQELETRLKTLENK